MSTEGQILRSIPYGRTKKRTAGFIFCLLVFLCGGLVFAVEQAPKGQADKAGPPRYRVFPLRHISAEQGKGYLTELGIGTVSQLPGPNTLLVTASASELVKASAILELVDAEQQYVVKPIFAVSEAEDLPSNERIASEAGNISVGTFSALPARGLETRVIIDIHDDAVIAVAPAEELEKITAAIERIRNKEIGTLQPTEPQETPDSNEPAQQAEQVESDKPDEFFGKLLEKLTEAETMVAEPNEPTTAAAEPQQKELADPSADGEKIEQLAGQPQESKEAETEDEITAEETQAQAIAEPEAEEEATETEETAADAEPTIQKRLYEPEPIPIGEEELTLDLPEKLNVVDLLDLLGKYLNLDYMYDPAKVKGEVALKLQGPVKVKELYPLAESVLKFRNFVMTRKGNLVTIVPSAEVLNIDPTLMYDEKGKVEYGDVIVTRLFNLQYIDTVSAKNLLGQMRLGANITDITDTGTLIVTGYAYRMGRVEELLKIIDKPGEPKHFRFRQLKYTMAKTLAPKVKTLAEQLGTVSVTIAAPAAAQRRPPVRETAAQRRDRLSRERGAIGRTTSTKPAVYLEADERTNRILMIGLEEQLAVVDELIDTLDVEQQDLRALRLYDIQHVDAQEVKSKLQELGIIGGERGALPARPTPTKAATRSAAPAAVSEGLVEEPQVVIIESTNSLLVNATAEQHVQIAMIISYVDSETLADVIPYEIYPLENQNPEDLAGVLQQLIQETIKDKEGKIQRVIKKEEDIVIVPDENTFSIIVYASKKNQKWIKKLIKTLDKRRPQVLIDVSLVEITEEKEFAYDLSLLTNATGDHVKDNIAIEGFFLPNKAAGSGSIIEAGFNLFDKDGPTSKVRGFYNEGPIQMLLDLIDKKGYGRILARPKILVNDNEEGVIRTTERTYVKETTLTYPSGATDTTPALQSTTYKPYEAKIELVITPHISEGNLLRLEVAMVREDFEIEVDSTAPPGYLTSNIDTIVTVPDGSTIILGGLKKLKQRKGGSKVPLLGDIPIVGALFRSVANTQDDRHLYVFVKANILRPDETIEGLAQLKEISAENRTAFEVVEREFQQREDWPGIKPDPIDPLHVLETD